MALTGTKICAVCGNEFKGAGNICKDGYYCNECEKIIRVSKIRVMHPLTLTWDKKGNEVKHDPIKELSLEEAGKDLENVIAYTEELRAKYDHHNAVFAVESVTTEKGGFLKPPVIYACGRVEVQIDGAIISANSVVVCDD